MPCPAKPAERRRGEYICRSMSGLDLLRAALAERYVLEHELGRGAMAIVYRAIDVKHRRPVAINVLSSETAATIGRERFLREIEIAASLTHLRREGTAPPRVPATR